MTVKELQNLMKWCKNNDTSNIAISLIQTDILTSLKLNCNVLVVLSDFIDVQTVMSWNVIKTFICASNSLFRKNNFLLRNAC